MFRRLIMAIFSLYMKYLLSNYIKHTWAVYMGQGGVKWSRIPYLSVVVVLYVENTLYSTNKYSCFRRVHNLYISYFMEHSGDVEV